MSRATVSDSKKGPGRPRTGIGAAIGLRLYPNLEERLDSWIERQKDEPSKPEAIRRLLEQALALPQNMPRRKGK